MVEKKKRKRANLITVIPGQLYQRAGFMTWARDKKERLIAEYDIGLVVNLWSKADPEVSSDSDIHYLHMPMKGNVPMEGSYLEGVSIFIRNSILCDLPVLIHCEAGVNRSVWLSAVMYAQLEGVSGKKALAHMKTVCGRVKMNRNLEKHLLESYL